MQATPLRTAARRPPRLRGTLALLCFTLCVLAGCGSTNHAKSATHHDPTTTAARPVGVSAANAEQPGRTLTAAEQAKERRWTVGEFGRRGSGPGQLKEPFGIAIDHHSGDVYVVDTDNSRIDKFTNSGRFLMAWGWGVADGRTHALQTCTTRCFTGSRGPGAGQLEFPEGVAVDDNPTSSSYHDIYVVDIWNHRVQKFSPGGRFLLMWGGSVNRTAHANGDRADEDICPVKRGDACGKGVEGPAGGQLELAVEGTFIAVGANDEVYVGQRNYVKVFSASGHLLSRFPLAPAPEKTGSPEAGGVKALAVDSSGDIYVVRHSVVGVDEYSPAGVLLRTLEYGPLAAYAEGPTPALSLDPAGDIFVDVYGTYQHRIDEFNSSGVRIATFDWGPKSPPGIADREDGLPGIAYNPLTKTLYMVNADVNVTPVVSRVRIVRPPRR